MLLRHYLDLDAEPLRVRMPPRPSKLDPFKPLILPRTRGSTQLKLQLGRDLQRLQPLQQCSFQRSLPISKAQIVTAILVAAHAFAREQGHER